MLLHASAEGREAPAFTPAASAICALAAALAVLEHIAIELLMRPLSPPHWAERIADAVAAMRVEPDLALFEPWQPWSHVLVQEGWWQLGAGVVGLLAVGGALEAELGLAATLIAVVLVLPIAAIGAMIEGSEPGISDLVVGLGAVALARLPGLAVRWRLSYYAISEVGSLRLFRMPLALVLALYIAQELRRCHLHHAQPPSLAWLGAAAVGAAIGVVSRRLVPPEAHSLPPPSRRAPPPPSQPPPSEPPRDDPAD